MIGMKLREEQANLQTLLKDTIPLLCKNSLQFNNGFVIEALIGITTDDDSTFLLKLEETFGDISATESEEDENVDDEIVRHKLSRLSRKRPQHGDTHDTRSKRHRSDYDTLDASDKNDHNSFVSESGDDAVNDETIDSEAVEADSIDEDTIDEDTIDEGTIDGDTSDDEGMDGETMDSETMDGDTVDGEAIVCCVNDTINTDAIVKDTSNGNGGENSSVSVAANEIINNEVSGGDVISNTGDNGNDNNRYDNCGVNEEDVEHHSQTTAGKKNLIILSKANDDDNEQDDDNTLSLKLEQTVADQTQPSDTAQHGSSVDLGSHDGSSTPNQPSATNNSNELQQVSH